MPKVLIVDDDPHVLLAVGEMLKMLGHEPIKASCAAQALTLFQVKNPAMVITDLNMPDRSGSELLLDLKAIDPRVPVVILTGAGNVDSAIACIKSGAHDFIAKPMNISQLQSVLDNAMNGSPEEEGTVMLTKRRDLRQVGEFEVRKILGFGSHAIVYHAERIRGEETIDVALKILRGEVLEGRDTDAIIAARFTREAEAVSRLNHPNIVHIYDYGYDTHTGLTYIAMEFVHGTTLDRRIDEVRRMNEVSIAKIIRQIADALAEIHLFGLCHRDIKPQNIMVTDDMQVKVTDFGVVLTDDSNLTAATRIVGTPFYMAPESFESSKVDGRADIFSLGVLAYELLLGSTPFYAENLPELMDQVLNTKPVEPRKKRPGFPEALQRILARMLAKAPADRYPAALDLMDDLDAFIAGKPRERSNAEIFRSATSADWS